MLDPTGPDITRLLIQVGEGNRAAVDELLPLIYGELRRLAGSYFRRERPNHTLQPTALVHEAYLRLVDQTQVEWRNRAHFLAVAATQMRRILVDHARGHAAGKRGGAAEKLPLDDALAAADERGAELLAVDEALKALAGFDADKSRLVELRYFGGLTIEETAAVMNISVSTANRQWRMTKAWLYVQLARGPA
jgi:RNA polymerase sigma factor (TIGR02999 family)